MQESLPLEMVQDTHLLTLWERNQVLKKGDLDLILCFVIYLDFPLDFTEFFQGKPGKHFIQFSTNKMQDFRNFVLHNWFFFLRWTSLLKLQRTNHLKESYSKPENPNP